MVVVVIKARLIFRVFQVEEIGKVFEFLYQLFSSHYTANPNQPRLLLTTGGGAFKYERELQDAVKDFGVKIESGDEMKCLILGLNFLCTRVDFELLQFMIVEGKYQVVREPANSNDLYPYLLVNIGSGVSILKVLDNDNYERISGSTLGGGTFRGLLSLLTSARTFDEMLELAERGDNKCLDLLVGDIYGGDYSKTKLASSTIASSFGKLRGNQDLVYSEGDIACSLLYMISNNIAQLAYLCALNHNIKNIFFAGFFIRGHGKLTKRIRATANDKDISTNVGANVGANVGTDFDTYLDTGLDTDLDIHLDQHHNSYHVGFVFCIHFQD